MKEGLGLAAKLNLRGVGNVEPAAVVTNVGANVPRCSRCLNGGVAADDKNRRSGQGVAQRGSAVFCTCQGLREGDVVRSTVMVDVICAEDRAGELLQEISLFVGDP